MDGSIDDIFNLNDSAALSQCGKKCSFSNQDSPQILAAAAKQSLHYIVKDSSKTLVILDLSTFIPGLCNCLFCHYDGQTFDSMKILFYICSTEL